MPYWKVYPFLIFKIIHCAILFSIFFIGSLSVILYQSVVNNKIKTVENLQIAVNFLDSKINDANKANLQVLSSASENCETSSDVIANALINFPSSQSISVVKNRVVICSSLKRNVGLTTVGNDSNTITLITSEVTMPGQPILLVTKSDNGFSAVSTLHVETLLRAIKFLDTDERYSINFSDNWINDKLKLMHGKNVDDMKINSTQFPFSISTHIDTGTLILQAMNNNLIVIISLLVLVIMAIACYCRYGNDLVLKSAILYGLMQDQFKPFAQAIVNENGETVGCEVLMRWLYKGKLINPMVFIPIAEKSGYIVAMTVKLIDAVHQVCIDKSSILRKPLYISINICPIQLTKAHAPVLIEACRKLVQDPSFAKFQLVLELTERQIMNNDTFTLGALAELRQLGIKFAIDDFGTGYSCLDKILDFHIDIIKLDRYFIEKYPDCKLSLVLIDNMLDLAKHLKVSVIAEGVETTLQADYLKLKGVKSLQGYLYSKPSPLSAILDGSSVA